MKSQGSLRQHLEAAVMERHCANHPLTEKWVGGQISRNAMMGWAIEHWHWVNKMPEAAFSICAKAPKDVIAKWHVDVTRLLDSPDFRERLAILGAEAAPTTPEQFAAFIGRELTKYARIVKASGAKVD